MNSSYTYTEKNKLALVINGYTFHKEKTYKSKIYWNCTEHDKINCKVRAHTENDVVVLLSGNHCHTANAANVNCRSILHCMKEKSVNSNRTQTSTQCILAETCANISQAVAAEMPRPVNLKRTIQRNRETGVPTFRCRSDIELPNELKVTLKGELFLMHDSGNTDERILIFTTNENLNILMSSGEWFMDGTFDLCPILFYQLFTVHAFKGKLIVPLVFCLLPNKQQVTYEKMFQALKNLKPELKPNIIMTDFEVTIVNAFNLVFGNTLNKFCLFHWSQNIWRRICNEGLKTMYNTDATFAMQMKMILALAFVPSADVVYAFELLAREMPQNVNNLIDFIEDNYIGRLDSRIVDAPHRRNPRFAIDKWNMYCCVLEDTPRTNNSVEGWHNGFSRLCTSNPSIFDFISAIQKQQCIVELQTEQLVAGDEIPPTKAKYRDLEKRLKNVVQDYNKDDILQYLRGISHNLHYFVREDSRRDDDDE